MSYDGVGNVLTRTRVGNGTAAVTYSYNRNSNQLGTATPSGSSALSYSYDADGNLLKRTLGKTTQLSIAYNADGRPMSAAGESFAYDGFGERVLIGITGSGTHDIFGLGGALLAENNSLGQPQRSYIYLNGVPLAVVDGFGNISYVLSGQLGQPQKMASGAGALTWDMIADEFGQLVSQPVGQTGANSLRFPGQVNDAATALYYNHFRDYDPSLGRYIQTDPIGQRGGINPYGYVGGNPLAYVDPLGLEVFRDNTMGPLQVGDIWGSELPNYPNAQVYTSNGRRFIAPKGTDWCAIKAAGQANGLNPNAIERNVGQYGKYDFQRIGGKHPEYIDASNYGVGTYMNGAGYGLWETNLLGGLYSFFNSSNANSPKQSVWWDNGWNDANNDTCTCQAQGQ